MRTHPSSILALAAGVGLSTLVTLLAGSVVYAAGAPAEPPKGGVEKAAEAVRDEVADGLLSLRVRTALLEKLGVDGLRVSVDVENGHVALGGEVKQKATAEIAADVAKSVSGVITVHESIQIRSTPAEQTKGTVDRAIDKTQAELDDALLESRVKANLIDRLGRTGFAIEVEATDGVVSLSGKVPEKSRRAEAVGIATQAKGTKKVVDLLKE